jgi:hypothetical protein
LRICVRWYLIARDVHEYFPNAAGLTFTSEAMYSTAAGGTSSG